MDVHFSDFITIALLVVLEGLLSADNALVLAFFRPPALAIQTPASPLYKTTRGPEHLPWPTDVTSRKSSTISRNLSRFARSRFASERDT